MSFALADPLGDAHAAGPSPDVNAVADNTVADNTVADNTVADNTVADNTVADNAVADEVVLPGQQLATALTDEVWALLDLDRRTPDEDDLLVHAAHAAAYHLRDEGTPTQIVRSEWLCSRVHAVLGRPEASLHHARRTYELCTAHLIGDWDLAFAHEALARAHAIAGDGEAARRHTAEARQVRIADPVHRDLLEADLATIPGRHPLRVITAGVDLAASPRTTGVAVLSGRRILELAVDVDDDGIVALTGDAERIGIDCPLGWPRAFVAMLADPSSPPRAGQVADRDLLAYRETDRWVRQHAAPLRPLSVSADRIAHAAFRCAALLPRLAQPVDRTGHGRVVETYPAGTLLRWGLPFRRYKGADGLGLREQIVDALTAVLDVDPRRAELVGSDHALDAVIAALTARAAASGRATLPTAAEFPAARDEGWIALPTGALSDLDGGGAETGPIEQIRPY